MSKQRLDEETIFEFARKISSPELRAEYVDQACGTDNNLKDRVAHFLSVYDEEKSFLEHPPEACIPTVTGPISEKSGDSIGKYKLLQQIGEGGFGIVYMAEQQLPVKRKVALKIIKPGMDTKDVVARFEAERQALALMDHPNIAKVFDGGVTDTGRPYFVMELVKGVPITEFCDSNRSTTSQRLELFHKVCQAIQHAHQKGVIHRDIKPSNVMVTLHDNQPVPKVIDFGVAKAISQELTEKTMFTAYGQMIGTPQYMSPEQAQMSGLDIDTRSDVYSLGVLLYELLTGTTPLDIKDLRNTAYAELQRLICESEPLKPSTRVSGLGEQSVKIANNRGIDPRKLNSTLRGDIDWIVMKALEKERNRRFESAGSLASDIERFLADQPILARPPSTAYQLRKFFRRNRSKVWSGLATVSIACLLLIVALNVVKSAAEKEHAAEALRMAAVERSRAEDALRDSEEKIEKLDTRLRDLAIDAALEALQNVDYPTANDAIQTAKEAGASGMWMDILNGRMELEKGNWEDAASLFQNAIEAEPDRLACHANYVIALCVGSQVDLALDYTRKLNHLTAIDSYDYLFRAEAQKYTNWDDYSSAIIDLGKAIDARDSAAARIARAVAYAAQTDVTQDETLVDRALKDLEYAKVLAKQKDLEIQARFFVESKAALVFLANNHLAEAQQHHDSATELLEAHSYLDVRHLPGHFSPIDYYAFVEDLDPEKRDFHAWKELVKRGAVGGVAGMYGICSIREHESEFENAFEQVDQIYRLNPTADVATQLGLMAIHAGDVERAEEYYQFANKAKAPLIRMDAQWTALLLGKQDEVLQNCEEMRSQYDQFSSWAKLAWEVFTREVNSMEEVLERSGNDRRMACEGLLSLGIRKLMENTPESREEAVTILEKSASTPGWCFSEYATKGILHDLENNPNWPLDLILE